MTDKITITFELNVIQIIISGILLPFFIFLISRISKWFYMTQWRPVLEITFEKVHNGELGKSIEFGFIIYNPSILFSRILWFDGAFRENDLFTSFIKDIFYVKIGRGEKKYIAQKFIFIPEINMNNKEPFPATTWEFTDSGRRRYRKTITRIFVSDTPFGIPVERTDLLNDATYELIKARKLYRKNEIKQKIDIE